jgi:hypothetical protein
MQYETHLNVWDTFDYPRPGFGIFREICYGAANETLIFDMKSKRHSMEWVENFVQPLSERQMWLAFNCLFDG